jgi:peptidyl-tRNA hydrolase
MISEYIIVRSDLKMGKGKIGGQCAHASELLSYTILRQFFPEDLKRSIKVDLDSLVSFYYLNEDSSDLLETYYIKGLDYLLKWHNRKNLFRKVVCKVESEKILFDIAAEARSQKYPTILIRDAGLTQIEPNTITCCAFLADTEDKNPFLDRIKTLSLL